MATSAELEAKIWELEGILVTIRAPRDEEVGEYNYQRAMDRGASLQKFKEDRLQPALNGHEYEIIDGDYATPHGRTKLENLRKSYKKPDDK